MQRLGIEVQLLDAPVVDQCRDLVSKFQTWGHQTRVHQSVVVSKRVNKNGRHKSSWGDLLDRESLSCEGPMNGREVVPSISGGSLCRIILNEV